MNMLAWPFSRFFLATAVFGALYVACVVVGARVATSAMRSVDSMQAGASPSDSMFTNMTMMMAIPVCMYACMFTGIIFAVLGCIKFAHELKTSTSTGLWRGGPN